MKRKNTAAAVIVIHLLLVSTILKPIALSAVQEPASQGESSEVSPIARIIKAYGGRDNLAKVRNIYTRGFQKISQTDNDGWVTSYLQRPGKLRIETALHQTPGVRLMSDGKVWVASGSTASFKEADGKTREGMAFLYNCLDLPFALAEGKWAVVEKGKNSNQQNEVLVVRNSIGEELTLTVNARTHLITMISATLSGGKAAISLEYQDFRQVGDIRFPFRMLSYYDRKPYAQLTLSEVKQDREMAGSLFSPMSSVKITPWQGGRKKGS